MGINAVENSNNLVCETIMSGPLSGSVRQCARWGYCISTVYWNGFRDCVWSICGVVVRGNNAAGAVTLKTLRQVSGNCKGLFDGVSPEIRAVTKKAVRLRGLSHFRLMGIIRYVFC